MKCALKSAAVILCLLAAIPLMTCCTTQESSILVSASVDDSDTEPLVKPGELDLEARSDQRRITLTWDDTENTSGYEIYFSSDGESYSHVLSTNNLTYETDELTPGNVYYFRVIPYNSKAGQETVYGDAAETSLTCVDSIEIDGYAVGDTYVHIDIDEQTMWYYKNNKLVVETPIVTGTAGACDTPTGYFEVLTLASPAHLVGPTWDVTTEYWVGINQANDIGLHDSPWRETGYGGDIYTYDGSNGCINTPFDAMKTIYENITIGTPVIISGSVETAYSGDYSYELATSSDNTSDESGYSDESSSYEEGTATDESYDEEYSDGEESTYDDYIYDESYSDDEDSGVY